MFVPTGYAEAEVINIIDSIAKKLAPSFAFGSYTIGDIIQEARLFALEALPRYSKDGATKLSTFLYTHVQNRLITLLRDKYHRPHPPCSKCHEFALGNTDKSCSDSKLRCKAYNSWATRNLRKAQLAKNAEPLQEEKAGESNVANQLAAQEIIAILDLHLSTESRKAFLQLKAGQPIRVRQRERLLAEIRGILTEKEFEAWAE